MHPIPKVPHFAWFAVPGAIGCVGLIGLCYASGFFTGLQSVTVGFSLTAIYFSGVALFYNVQHGRILRAARLNRWM
jgi:hypothetical protein